MAEPAPVVNLAAVRTMIASARSAGNEGAVRRREPVLQGTQQGDWLPDTLGLPPDCPVRPLGLAGKRLWFLDGIGQVLSFEPPYGKGDLLLLFGGELHYLEWHWPRWGKEKSVNGWANEALQAVLIKACAKKGPWDSFSRVRGRGCWQDANGGLVVHTGTAVIYQGREESPGEIGPHVYPTRPPLPEPLRERDAQRLNPGALLLHSYLNTWNWGRPGIDPHLLLGWIGAAFLGAALPWRPMVFLTGGKGTGKSTLQSLVKAVLGYWLVDTADTTAPGIYQRIGLDCIAVAVDELESDIDDKRSQAVLKLARLASSGAAMLRGGADHTGTEFAARSAFLFSSINAPPMKPAELSRMALLQLDKLPDGAKEPDIEPGVFGILGQAILRLLLREWPRFDETYQGFAGELGAAGMDSRGQKQFGTLLTCADLILHQGWNAERLSFAHEHDGDLRPWREILRPASMLEFENATDNWLGCINRLLGVRVEAWRGGMRSTVGQVLADYFEGRELDVTQANTALSQAGLRIVFRGRPVGMPPLPEGAAARRKHERWLVVQNNGPLVRTLFDGSIWYGADGAGVWSGALRQGPRHLWMAGQERVAGVQGRATLLSLEALYGPGGIMAEVKGVDEEGELT